MRGLLVGSLVAVLASCGPPPAPVGPAVEASRPGRVRAFTEHTAVTSVAAAGRWLFVGTDDGLLRWDVRAGTHTWVGVEDGLPSRVVEALATTPAGALWTATPAGLARGVEGAWTVLRPAPVGRARQLWAPDEEVLWAAGSDGLARLCGGRWERYLPGVEVTGFAADGRGGLWIGTRGRGLMHLALTPGGGLLSSFGPAEGCPIADVTALALDGETLYVAGSIAGASLLAVYEGARFFTYQAQPALAITALVRGRDGVQLFGGERVLLLGRVRGSELPGGPVRFTLVGTAAGPAPARLNVKPGILKAAAPAKAAPAEPPPQAAAPAPGPAWAAPAPLRPVPEHAPRLFVQPVGPPLPPELTAVVAHGTEMWLGTRTLGLARYGSVGLSFLRTHELTEAAERLTVGCQSPTECYVATGGTRSWRFDGERFTPAAIDPEPDARVLAVVQDARGRVVAIHRGATGRALRLSRLTGDVWLPLAMQELEVPNSVPEITFAVFSPAGTLWIGLHYRDPDGEDRPYGAAEVDLDEAKVIYHRTFPQGVATPPGSLPIPNDVTAVLFRGKDLWFATKSGACRVQGKTVTLFTENEGLESELLRDIEEGPGGEIWVASMRGVGRYDGKRWRFERQGPLGAKIRSFARDPRGPLWVGTDRGLVRVSGPQVDRYEAAQGLLEPDVIEVTLDSAGRVWALSPRGVTLVSR
jgi:ligand-binding sensor domain-containing protein